MLTDLLSAPAGLSLHVVKIIDEAFAVRLLRMGIGSGTQMMRLDEAVAVCPVKVRVEKKHLAEKKERGAKKIYGLKGDAVLSAWLSTRMVMHLNDERRIPLPECPPGSYGHLEGVTGNDIVESSLRELGIEENDSLRVIRKLPPMNYRCTVNGKQEAWMNESLAAHVLGDTSEGPAQFSSVGVGEEFVVRKILPGEDAKTALTLMNVSPKARLILNSVSVSPNFCFSAQNPVVCVSKDGLRLYFQSEDARGIMVRYDEAKYDTRHDN